MPFRMSRSQVPRAVGASAGLAVAGALVGAVLGVGVLAVWGLLLDGPGGFPYVWFAFEFAAVVGALLGGLLLPLVTWTVLPHVAVGRILAERGAGTAAGAAIAILIGDGGNPLVVALGGVLGFVATVVQLKVRQRRRPQLHGSTHNAT